MRSRSNYVGLHHHAAGPIDSWNTGAFVLNRANPIEDIRDGLGQTIFISEKKVGNDPYADLGWISGTKATLRNMGSLNSRLLAAVAPRLYGRDCPAWIFQ
jgi:hypothetical protein